MRPPRPAELLVAALVLSVVISPLGRDLFVGDETKYGQVVREMRASGSFFLPTLDGTPFTHKPPLHFWLVALLTYPLGLYSIWPFVLPSLAAFFLLLWLMGRIARELVPDADPSLAAFLSGSSLLIWGSAQTARMDVAFTALIAAGAWMLFRFLNRADFRALVAAAFFIAVAALVKGPMAPVIFATLFVFEWWRRKGVPRGNYLPALLVLIVLPLLWLVPAMLMGGDAYTQEVLEKQIARRAVGAWVHKAAPWYYVTHAPATLFPWFFLLVVAIGALYRRRRATDGENFCVTWIAAVLVPYSILSSKLDVYMMPMLPPVALLIAGFLARKDQDRWTRWGRRVNVGVLLLLALSGAVAAAIGSRYVKEPDRAVAQMPEVRGMFVVLAVAAIVALAFSIRRRDLVGSTVALGLVPLVMLTYAGSVAMPVMNEMASTRPLVSTLVQQGVAPEEIVLHTTPYLWVRQMPRELERVRNVGADAFDDSAFRPRVVVTSRKHATAIRGALAGYRKTAELRMIGKWFDVYRR